ncbi:MAG TPA: peptidase S10 [Trueperaceae bacterium]
MAEESGAAGTKVATLEPRDDLRLTRHHSRIGGAHVPYTATAGTMVLREESFGQGDQADRAEGLKPRAQVFVVSYVRDDVADSASRPVTFCFNGGPGSSSVWLHLGMLGPRRVDMGPEGLGETLTPQLVDNEHSLLDLTDLVFIDPVSTGYSRALKGEKPKEFHGFKKDIESVGEVIRLWCTKNGRWTSPKYLAGESYGTTRAAGLAGHLQERHGLYLSGLLLISSVLDFSTLLFGPGNDLPPAVYLPTYAATAHYHGKLDDELQGLPLRELLDRVETFVRERYWPALFQGASLPEGERRALADQVARFSGLSSEFVEANDLRVEIFRFTKELLRGERRTVGRLDSRYTGIDRDAGGEHFEYDPAYAAFQGTYTAALNHYLRSDLDYSSDLPYEIIADLWQTWSYKEFENRYVNVGETLRKAMSINPQLRVHVASGYFDLATPHFATDYTFAHLGLDPTLRENLEFSYYEAGHMMYVHRQSLAELKERLARFLLAAAD